MRFYGLPPAPEEDRHKWLFSPAEAREFIAHRSKIGGMRIIAHDVEGKGGVGLTIPRTRRGRRLAKRVAMARPLLFREDLDRSESHEGTQWYVLRR